MIKIVPIILSGGFGTRLWPLSREQYPKQYLPLVNNNTMFQNTILRIQGLKNLMPPIVVCNTEHRFLVKEQLHKIGVTKYIILLEPVGRNTAPAIAAAAFQAVKSYKDNNIILFVLAADHIIDDNKALHMAVYAATKQAMAKKLVTFGVKPTSAHTGYGYIKVVKNIEDSSWHRVEKFIEKPDKKTAKKYINDGNYLWNSGMFMFQAGVLINEVSLYSAAFIKAVKESFVNASEEFGFIFLQEQAFKKIPKDSIDYLLMEKSNNVVAVPLNTFWSDVGSWSAIDDISAKDCNSNAIKGDVFIKDTTNSYINASHHTIAAIGLKDLIVVDTADVVLIVHKNKAEEVKDIVGELKKQQRQEVVYHRKVYRPWGWYDVIEKGENFQIKRLHINPQSKLSLQKHYKRAEHWAVIKGIATVINGKKHLTLASGQSTYIAISAIHSLENNTDTDLEVIEVQSGTYLGEDDIVRFKDIYGRDLIKNTI